jgi:hypothetical protein
MELSCRAVLSSTPRILGTWARISSEHKLIGLSSVCALFCIGRGLAMSRSNVQGDLPKV